MPRRHFRPLFAGFYCGCDLISGGIGVKSRVSRTTERSTMTDSYEQALTQAKTDLAFALAQGDGYAEDEAAARIAHLEYLGRERWIEAAEVARQLDAS